MSVANITLPPRVGYESGVIPRPPCYLVYLAGPIKGCSYRGATDWREYVRSKLPPEIGVLSPMRDKEFLRRKKKISGDYPELSPLCTDTAIVARDRNDVTRADAILFFLSGAEEVSEGTMVELGWADLLRKPMVLIMEKKKNPHNHPFSRAIPGFVSDDLDEGIQMICSILAVECE